MKKIIINGKEADFNGDPEMPLLWFLREDNDLKGTKFGCGIGQCGACTVHLEGKAVRSCSIPMAALSEGAKITTIEGLADGAVLHPVQQAWITEDVPQCGYCQAGQIMAVVDLIQRYPNPSDEEIAANHTNLCRCGTYVRMRKAIRLASEQMLQNAKEV